MTLTALVFFSATGGVRIEPTGQAAPSGRSIAPFFTRAASSPKAVDADGFLRRWLLLEPVNKPSRTNTNLTSVYVRKTLLSDDSAGEVTAIPGDGEKTSVAGQELAWHALDSSNFNVKLFRFAYGLDKPTYGIVCWAVTVVNSPREVENVRLSVGSNSASIWWLNSEETVDLFNDRHMIVDDVVSRRLTLHKGRNVLRGGLINGPGLSDFCVRFIDEDGRPITGISTSLEPSAGAGR
jgi:hypothetical protein